MTRVLAALVASLAVAASAPARASDDSGLTLGLRASYALPLGEAGGGADLADLTTGAVPVQIELGWRFDRHWQAGAYFAWGPTMDGSDARAQLRAMGARDVSGHFEQRLGVQGIYSLLPSHRFAPWVGLSAGYEWTRYADAKLSDGKEIEVGLRGLEAALHVGADYRVTPRFAVGPFASFSVGQYRARLTWVEDGEDSVRRLGDRGLHEWLQLGVKGTFDL
jgi:hypothetical protein